MTEFGLYSLLLDYMLFVDLGLLLFAFFQTAGFAASELRVLVLDEA